MILTEVNYQPLLSIRDFHARFPTSSGIVHAVRGVSLDVDRGERVGIVGESGSGKSVTAHAIIRLLPSADLSGAILLDGQDTLKMSNRALRQVRGLRVGMVFQDPMTALNPVRTIGKQVVEAGRHRGLTARAAREQAIDLLGELGIPKPAERFESYPHQFSGGMRQRVIIAAALMGEPDLLIADEPTTALDVRLQARLMDLLWRLSEDRHMAVLFISHDLSLVAGFADRVAVMYAGSIQERATATNLFKQPSHPYTRGLLGSVPIVDPTGSQVLAAIPGAPPSPLSQHIGCPFEPRCADSSERCLSERPALVHSAVGGHEVACHHPQIGRVP